MATMTTATATLMPTPKLRPGLWKTTAITMTLFGDVNVGVGVGVACHIFDIFILHFCCYLVVAAVVVAAFGLGNESIFYDFLFGCHLGHNIAHCPLLSAAFRPARHSQNRSDDVCARFAIAFNFSIFPSLSLSAALALALALGLWLIGVLMDVILMFPPGACPPQLPPLALLWPPDPLWPTLVGRDCLYV